MRRPESDAYRVLRDIIEATVPILVPIVPPGPWSVALGALPSLLGLAHDLAAEGVDVAQAITRIQNGEPLFEAADDELRERLRRRWNR